MPIPKKEVIIEKTRKLFDTSILNSERYGITLNDIIVNGPNNIININDINNANVINDLKYSIDYKNGALQIATIGRLLMDGHSIHDILSPNFQAQLLEDKGKEVKETFVSNTDDSGIYLHDAYEKVLAVVTDEINQRLSGKAIYPKDFLDDKNSDLFLLSSILEGASKSIKIVDESGNLSNYYNSMQIDDLTNKESIISKKINDYKDLFKAYMRMQGKKIPGNPQEPSIKDDDFTLYFFKNGLEKIGKIMIDNKIQEVDSYESFSSYGSLNPSYINLDEALEEKYDIFSDDKIPTSIIEDNLKEQGDEYKDYILGKLFDESSYDKIFSYNINEDTVNLEFQGIDELSSIKNNVVEEVQNVIPKDNSSNYMTDEELFKKVDELVDDKPRKFSSYGLDLEQLNKALNGDKPDSRRISYTKNAIPTLIIGRMLMKGVSIDDCLDLNKFENIRKETTDEVMDLFKKGGPDFLQYACDGYYHVQKEIYDKYMNTLTGKETIEDFLVNDKLKNIAVLSQIVFDAYQEYNKIVREDYSPSNVDPNEAKDLNNRIRPVATYGDVFLTMLENAKHIYDISNGKKDDKFQSYVVTTLSKHTGLLYRNEQMESGNISIDDSNVSNVGETYALMNMQNANDDNDLSRIFNTEISKEQIRNIALSFLDSKKLSKIISFNNNEPSVSNTNILLDPPTNETDIISEIKNGIVDEPYSDKVDKWYKSFEKELIAKGYDTANSVTASYLKKITVERSSDDNGDYIRNTTFALDQNSEDFDPSFLTKNFVLHNLANDKKTILYNLSKKGELALLPLNNEYMHMSLIYTKDDETCGISSPVDEIPEVNNAMMGNRINEFLTDVNNKNNARLFGERATKDKYNELVKKHFPGVQDPYLFARNITGYDAARQTEDLNGILPEEELMKRHVKEAWEAAVINDFNRHQDYYLNGNDMERSEAIRISIFKSFNPDYKNEEYDRIAELNPINYSNGVEDALKKAANKFTGQIEQNEPENLEEIDKIVRYQVEKEKIEKLLNDGCVVDGAGKSYKKEPNGKPWDAINKITRDMLLGKEIYVLHPNSAGDKLEPHRLKLSTTSGEAKLSEDVAKVMHPLHKKNIIETLKKYKKLIDETKTTWRDSSQFKDLKKGLELTIGKLKNSLVPAVFEENIKIVKGLANEYYFAKLDESHNARRGKRFNIADALRNLEFKKNGDEIEGVKINKKPEDLARERIAGKVIKTYAKAIQDAKDVNKKNLGNKLLDKDQRGFFSSSVNKLLNSEKFKELYGDKDLDFLLKEFDRDADELAVDVLVNHKALSKKQKEVVENKEDKVLNNNGNDEQLLIY